MIAAACGALDVNNDGWLVTEEVASVLGIAVVKVRASDGPAVRARTVPTAARALAVVRWRRGR